MSVPTARRGPSVSLRSTLRALVWDGDDAYAVAPDGTTTKVRLYVASNGNVVAKPEQFDNGADQMGEVAPRIGPFVDQA